MRLLLDRRLVPVEHDRFLRTTTGESVVDVKDFSLDPALDDVAALRALFDHPHFRDSYLFGLDEQSPNIDEESHGLYWLRAIDVAAYDEV